MEKRPDRAAACARLSHYGVLSITGDDARAFLHAQLTNDFERLAPGRAAYAGWCSANGRLLASFLVIPQPGGFLLQLARDLAPAVAKRLQMFVLRAKVKLGDASGAWAQLGIWGEGSAAGLAAAGLEPPGGELEVVSRAGALVVQIAAGRFLVLAALSDADQFARHLGALETSEEAWALEEIRAGRPLIDGATQDRFVPQMVNFEAIGGLDFGKGCYPGQEVVARTQYRGQLKRRMYRLRTAGSLRPGQDLFSDDSPGQPAGTVVTAADGEALAVLQISSVESGSPVRAGAGAEPLELLPLPYSR